MEKEHLTAQQFLMDSVIQQKLCVQCGACVGYCPYFNFFDGKVVAMDVCRSETGRCVEVCPQADHDDAPAALHADAKSIDRPIGQFKDIYIARASEASIRQHAQYGGVVSSVLAYALEKGVIKSAVLTNKGDEMSPKGVLAETKADILACAGSRYTSSASLSALNRGKKDNKKKIAVVGVPCQISALSRMKAMFGEKDDISDPIALSIGLFCTWSISYRELYQYMKQEGMPSEIIKFDIPPPPSQVLRVQTREGWKELPLDNIRPFIHDGCSFCLDMTAELADISVGTVENKDGWNTVIVRSDAGMALMKMAVQDNIIKPQQLPEKYSNHLQHASANKKRKGLAARQHRKPLS